MALIRLTPLDGDQIISLADAKAQVRVLHDREDDLIAAYRDAAVGHVERVSGVILAEGDFRWEMSSFPSRIQLPVGPVSTVDSVAYLDSDGEEADVPGTRFINGYVYPALGESWPSAYDYAAVTFTAGLGDPSYAPELIQAAKLLLSHYFNNRDAVVLGSSASSAAELPLGVQALIETYRAVLV